MSNGIHLVSQQIFIEGGLLHVRHWSKCLRHISEEKHEELKLWWGWNGMGRKINSKHNK